MLYNPRSIICLEQFLSYTLIIKVLFDSDKAIWEVNEMGYFFSQYHFHISHIARKQNKVTNALLGRPRVNVVSIACNHDWTSMIKSYAQDSDYQEIMARLAKGKHKIPKYSRKDFSLMVIGYV